MSQSALSITKEAVPDTDEQGVGDIKQQISTANWALEHFQFQDAMSGFARVLEQDPANQEASYGHNVAIQKTVHRWHFSMLNDQDRNDAFEAAIAKVVKGKVVLDVGSGSGLLAMMAARAGARMVYTCEMDANIAACAAQIVAANGYSDVVKVIGKKSDALEIGFDMAEKADVLVTETLDSAVLGEGLIPIVNDAKARLLVDNPVIIPESADLQFALLESRPIWNLNYAESVSGFDVRLFNQFSSNGFYPVRFKSYEHRTLSAATPLCQFNFALDELTEKRIDIPVEAQHDGVCHAVAYWFDLYLDRDHAFSTNPDNFNSHWRQAIQCFDRPMQVRAGEKYVLSAQQRLTRFDFSLIRVGQ